MKEKMIRMNKTFLFRVALVLFGCVLTYFVLGNIEKPEGKLLSNIPVKVQVHKAERVSKKKSFIYSGTIEASDSVPLSFTVTGNVSKVLVSEGEFVQKGQLLAKLDNATLKNMYNMSLATLKQAEDAYKRLAPMARKGSLPAIKFVEIETALQRARSATAIAKGQLDDCNLHAPMEGYVGVRRIEPGMSILPGVTAITIVKIDEVIAKISVSENEISEIAKEQKAVISVSALNYKKFSGMVEEIGVVANPITHTYKVKVCLQNSGHYLKPGMICNVRVLSDKTIKGVIVPNYAVQVDDAGNPFVFCVDDTLSRTIKRKVELGGLMDEGIELRNGLNPGERVVTFGLQKLVDGSKIIVVN